MGENTKSQYKIITKRREQHRWRTTSAPEAPAASARSPPGTPAARSPNLTVSPGNARSPPGAPAAWRSSPPAPPAQHSSSSPAATTGKARIPPGTPAAWSQSPYSPALSGKARIPPETPASCPASRRGLWTPVGPRPEGLDSTGAYNGSQRNCTGDYGDCS